MPTFEIKGINRSTSRKNTRTFRAADKRAALEQAVRDGLAPEAIVELPEPEPTDRQLAYAADLGARIPEGATRAEVSDLIDNALRNKPPADQRYRRFAERYGIEITRYTNKPKIFESIFATLKTPGRETELAAWFLFRVHRHRVQGSENSEIDGPDHPGLKTAAELLAQDEKFLSSIQRGYADDSLIWFGEFRNDDGDTIRGASTRTYAYRAAHDAVHPWARGNETPAPRQPTRRRTSGTQSPSGPKNQAAGCLIILVIFLFLVFWLL
jgi:hypothetical protein